MTATETKIANAGSVKHTAATAAPAKAATAAAVPATMAKTASRAKAKPVAKKSVAAAKAPATKVVKAAVKSAIKPVAKAAIHPKAPKAVKVKKPKLVRDSFTIPKAEYMVLDELKLRVGKLGNAAKKSELIRAGVKALAAMSDAAFLAALKAVPTIKTGRPSLL
ncbi:MAG: hypothetical protein WCH35_02800 [Comamonadaceae bacterium]